MCASPRESVSARRPTRAHALLGLPATLLLACDSGGAIAELARDHSPLTPMAQDGDKLWLMVRAAGVTIECGSPETRINQCDEDEQDLLDFLHENGIPEARLDHLRTPAFWSWFRERMVEIDACQEKQRQARTTAPLPCDPLTRMRAQNQRLGAILNIPDSARRDVGGILAVDLPGEPLASTGRDSALLPPVRP